MVVACIALIVALGGTSYAALKLPRNSVGNRQLKPNAVTSAKVRNGALTSKDFRRSSLPPGPRGPQGPKGEPAPGAIPRTAFATSRWSDPRRASWTTTSTRTSRAAAVTFRSP